MYALFTFSPFFRNMCTSFIMMPLSCALKKLQSGGAGGRATRDGGDGSAWWTVPGNDPVEGEPMTPKITGNRLIDVEDLAAVGTQLLDSYVKKIPLELHESRTGIASSFSWKCTSLRMLQIQRTEPSVRLPRFSV
jgi:hypothetical protein